MVFKWMLPALQALNASASPAGRRKGGLPKQGRQSNGDSHTVTSEELLCSLCPSQNGFGEEAMCMLERPLKYVGTVLTTPNAEKKEVGKS